MTRSPSPSYIHRIPGNKMNQAFTDLSGTFRIYAAKATSPSILTSSLPHSGHSFGMLNSFSLPVRCSRGLDDLRDDISRFFDDDLVSSLISFSLIKSSLWREALLDGRSRHFYRFENRCRGHAPVLPTLNSMSNKRRHNFFGRKLVGDRPARAFRRKA